MKTKINHYKWLDKHLQTFYENLGIGKQYSAGIISAHGDKCSWAKFDSAVAHIPFPHVVAIYLLSHERPFSKEVRDTDAGWVAPSDWVALNYERFKPHLPPVDESDKSIWCFTHLREVA